MTTVFITSIVSRDNYLEISKATQTSPNKMEVFIHFFFYFLAVQEAPKMRCICVVSFSINEHYIVFSRTA